MESHGSLQGFLRTVAELQQLARAQQLSGYLANNLSNEVLFPKCSAKITQDCTVPTPLVFPVPRGLEFGASVGKEGPSFLLSGSSHACCEPGPSAFVG